MTREIKKRIGKHNNGEIMNYKVVYFTRTGNCERIANKIAEKLDGQLVQVTDNKNWNGPIGFIKGGFYSTAKRKVEIELESPIQKDDVVVAVSPLWANGITPAIKRFLESIAHEDVHLVISSDGSSLKNRLGYKSVTDIIKNQDNEDEAIKALIAEIKG